MSELPSPENKTPPGARPAWRLPAMLVLAALAGAVGSKLIFKEKPVPATATASSGGHEQEVIDALSVSLEKVAEREMPDAAPLGGEEGWTLETKGRVTKLMFWLDQALPRVGGKFLFAPTVEDPVPTAFSLELPPDSRLRLCLALDAWGKLTAKDYEDTTPVAPLEKQPDLPANLDLAGTAPTPGAPMEKIRLEVKAAEQDKESVQDPPAADGQAR